MALKDRFSFKARGHEAGSGPNVGISHHESRGTTVARSSSQPRPSEFHLGVPDAYRVHNLTGDYSAGDSPANDSELEWFAEALDEPDVPMSIDPTVTSNPPRPRTRLAGYDEATGTLRIRFRDGAVYDYDDISPDQFESLQREQDSTGKWMARNGIGHLGSGNRIEG